jgi:predicted nucleic acid-binding Zn ribbon protein
MAQCVMCTREAQPQSMYCSTRCRDIRFRERRKGESEVAKALAVLTDHGYVVSRPESGQ